MMPVVGADLSKHLVLMNSGSRPPRCCRRSLAPQGGGTAPCDERAVFTAVVYALTSGCAWRHLPPTFSTSPATATAHRRFTVWTEAGPCGVGCTGRRWTNSGPRARSTGPRRSSTRPPFAPTGGGARWCSRRSSTRERGRRRRQVTARRGGDGGSARPADAVGGRRRPDGGGLAQRLSDVISPQHADLPGKMWPVRVRIRPVPGVGRVERPAAEPGGEARPVNRRLRRG
ncbi:transposase [Streptomyces sp. NPDC055037]